MVLDHASAILSESSTLTAEALSSVTIIEETEPPSRGNTTWYNIFSGLSQHIGGRYRTLPRSELEQAIESSVPAIIYGLGTEIAQMLIALCRGSSSLIKPTDRGMEAILHLPHILADNEHRFALIMDCLFWTLWEAAGRKGGQLYTALSAPSRETLEAFVALRHYFRHSDLDPKKEVLVERLFRKYTDRPFPLLPSQWKKAQKCLYEDVLALLQEAYRTL